MLTSLEEAKKKRVKNSWAKIKVNFGQGPFNNYVDKKMWVGGQYKVYAWSRGQKAVIM